METLSNLLILATEGGIPAESPWAKLSVPIGLLVFIGTVYMLMRSNLGTRRGYLVMSTSLWGFTFLLAIFWAFGAPGTPPNTGPQTLPGQELDEYQPIWVPFAQDSTVVTEADTYAAAADYPAGWSETVPEAEAENADIGLADISSFFSGLSDPYFALLTGSEVGEIVGYTTAGNGRPMIAAEFIPTCEFNADGELPAYCDGLEVGDAVPAGSVDDNGNPVWEEPVLLFAFFDGGNPYFPSYVMMIGTFVLFALHMVLLARDERRERQEHEEVAEETVQAEPEKVPVSA